MVTKKLLGLEPLKEQDVAAVEKFIGNIKASFGKKIINIILYGSKARGDARFDSDIDLLVIIKNDDPVMRRKILQFAAKTSLDFDLLLGLMVMSEKRWLDHQGLSLYVNIQKDGILLES